ncbi:A24 family peptidase [Streptomyces sp. NBC_00335]|uniref:prepilin peptidase n=1 Tax=unclassified Streptomyces TaxID=2593676 RepID=UPI002252A9F5|nr:MULTISPECIES: A24 family peptidase [unclassified Streptomyces]MCX5405343.1 A24 family peptidase [Streptomyces sp. NBC_00086]
MGITLFVAGVTLWGAAAGLFLPRAAYRLSVEAGLPWRSACPAGHPLTGPARGWLGRAVCPRCVPAGRWRGGYAPAAGAVLATTLVCLALGAGVGARPELAAWLLLAPITVLLCFVDQAVHRLPDVLTLPLAATTAAALGVAALFAGAGGSWTRALLGGLALWTVYLVLHVIHPPGMGFGDVTLALTVGQVLGWYGWFELIAGTFAAFLAATVHGYARLALRRVERGSSIAFGPFMAAGALAGVIYAGLGLGPDLGLGPVLGAGPVP